MLKFIRTLLFIIGIITVIDCAVLIASMKINFGTVIPLFIGLIFIIHAIYWRRIRQRLEGNKGLRVIWKALWVIFAVWLISFIVFAITLQKNVIQSTKAFKPVNAIIVLGGGVENGIPTPTLASRLDSAAPLIKTQSNAIVITSGGIGLGDSLSEAEAMANYLNANHSIPIDKVLLEGQSTSTEENLLFSQPMLSDNGVNLSDPIAIVTSDFHVPRSKAIAEHQGYEHPIMVASPTPLSIRYNAWFREYFAYVSGWLLNEY